ncbi:hypothetical protein AAMO2058_001357900 [Amorphochlora amoebiformis]
MGMSLTYSYFIQSEALITEIERLNDPPRHRNETLNTHAQTRVLSLSPCIDVCLPFRSYAMDTYLFRRESSHPLQHPTRGHTCLQRRRLHLGDSSIAVIAVEIPGNPVSSGSRPLKNRDHRYYRGISRKDINVTPYVTLSLCVIYLSSWGTHQQTRKATEDPTHAERKGMDFVRKVILAAIVAALASIWALNPVVLTPLGKGVGRTATSGVPGYWTGYSSSYKSRPCLLWSMSAQSPPSAPERMREASESITSKKPNRKALKSSRILRHK